MNRKFYKFYLKTNTFAYYFNYIKSAIWFFINFNHSDYFSRCIKYYYLLYCYGMYLIKYKIFND